MTEKIKEALEAMKADRDAEWYEELIREQDINEPAFAEVAFENEIFRSATLYKDASGQVRDKLIALLEQEENDSLKINGILLALAGIGDETVVQSFQKWEQNPPAWREKIYTGPATYAMEGGWCIEDGKKKVLTHDVCYAIEKQENCKAEESVYGGAAEDNCPHCGSSYVNILTLDGRDPRLNFLGIKGKIKIKTCHACLPWEENIFCKYEEDGESKVILQESGCGEFSEDEYFDKEECFVLSKEPVAKYYCSEWKGSAVGGAPKYINDASYPICPECGKRMKHLAQLGEDYTGYGNIYVWVCTDCKIVATMYEQS